jgi:hypothetical protein
MATLTLCQVLDRALSMTAPGSSDYQKIEAEMQEYGCPIPKIPAHPVAIEPSPFGVDVFLEIIRSTANGD